MTVLFVSLFFISLGLLLWGLVAPKSLAKHANKATKKELTRKQFSLFFGLVSFMFLILIAATASSNAQSGNQPVKSAQHQTETKSETITKEIPFINTNVDDSSMNEGTSKVTTHGINGVETIVYAVTYVDGQQTAKKVTSDTVTTQPINQVTHVGTYVAPAVTSTPASSGSSCNPNYSGYCVPDVSYDLDCSDIGHSVRVVGTDVYRFDADHDGAGCESY